MSRIKNQSGYGIALPLGAFTGLVGGGIGTLLSDYIGFVEEDYILFPWITAGIFTALVYNYFINSVFGGADKVDD